MSFLPSIPTQCKSAQQNTMQYFFHLKSSIIPLIPIHGLSWRQTHLWKSPTADISSLDNNHLPMGCLWLCSKIPTDNCENSSSWPCVSWHNGLAKDPSTRLSAQSLLVLPGLITVQIWLQGMELSSFYCLLSFCWDLSLFLICSSHSSLAPFISLWSSCHSWLHSSKYYCSHLTFSYSLKVKRFLKSKCTNFNVCDITMWFLWCFWCI